MDIAARPDPAAGREGGHQQEAQHSEDDSNSASEIDPVTSAVGEDESFLF